jgi:2'-5' RNA ligase
VKALHNKVDQALARVGIQPDNRAFLPHITIARFGRTAGPFDGLMLRSGGISSEPEEIEQFCLYESSLSHEGSLYTIVERYPLS